MKALLAVLLVVGTAHCAAQKPEVASAPDSSEVSASKGKYAGYAREAEALPTPALYRELVRLDAAIKSRIALAKPGDALAAALSFTDDDVRAASYASVLKRRGEAGDPYASFFDAMSRWDSCAQLQLQQGTGWGKQAEQCWQDLRPALKRASDAQIAGATFNIARLYENGFGVIQSKLVAAEWFVKAAEQYNSQKSRDEALTSVESALTLVPDHPAALRMRKAMLK